MILRQHMCHHNHKVLSVWHKMVGIQTVLIEFFIIWFRRSTCRDNTHTFETEVTIYNYNSGGIPTKAPGRTRSLIRSFTATHSHSHQPNHTRHPTSHVSHAVPPPSAACLQSLLDPDPCLDEAYTGVVAVRSALRTLARGVVSMMPPVSVNCTRSEPSA